MCGTTKHLNSQSNPILRKKKNKSQHVTFWIGEIIKWQNENQISGSHGLRMEGNEKEGCGYIKGQREWSVGDRTILHRLWCKICKPIDERFHRSKYKHKRVQVKLGKSK